MHFCYVVNDNASIMRATLPARYLLRRGHEVDLIVITLPEREPHWYGGKAEGLKVHEVERAYRSGHQVRALLDEIGADVVHAIGTGRATFWPAYYHCSGQEDALLVTDIDEQLSRVYGFPTRGLMRRWERTARRHSDLAIVVSRDMEEGFGRLEPRARLGLLPNAVDLESFDRYRGRAEEIRVRHGHRPTVTYMGFLLARYQAEAVVEVAEVVTRERPEVEFVIIGKGPMKGELEARVAEKGLGERVRFTGFVGDEEVPGYLCASDVLLFPIEDNEMNRARSPNKVHQFCAAEVPIVTNRVGEVGNTLGEYGIYYEFGSVEDCAAKVLGALGSGEPRPPRALAEANCWARRTEQYLEMVGASRTSGSCETAADSRGGE